MKKVLKSISLFIISFVFTLSINQNVEASTKTGSVHGAVTTSDCLNCGGTISSKNSTIYSFADYGMKVYTPNTYWYNNGKFYVHRENGTNLDMYCLDATLNGYYQLFAKRFLFEGVSPFIYAQDIATMRILTSNGTYMVKSTALRSIITLFGSNRSGVYTSNGAEALEKSYFGMAYKWITTDSSIRKSYDVIYNAFPANTTSLNTLKNYQGYYMEDTNNYTETAKNLFASALAEAAQYVESINESEDNKTSVELVSSISGIPSIESTGGNEAITMQSIKTFKLNNFKYTDKSWFSFDKLTYDNLLENLGVSSQPVINYIKIDDNKICENNNCSNLMGVNLFTKASNINTIEIAINFTGYTSSSDGSQDIVKCGSQPMDYTLTYKFYDENLNKTFTNKYDGYLGIVWYSSKTNTDAGASTQRFITIEELKGGGEITLPNTPTYKTGEVKDKVTLTGPCDCYDLYDECMAEIDETGDMYGPACQALYEGGCCVEIGEECESGDEIACKQYEEFCEAPKECDELDELCKAGDEDACDKYEEYCDEPKDCTTLNTQCEQGDQAACEEYDEFCTEETEPVQCVTKVENFDCCDKDNNLIISTLDNHKVNIKGPEDVYTCFVNEIDKQVDLNNDKGAIGIAGSIDDEGNSYTLIDDNKYCLVSCKEDYMMTMPTAKLVNAGRYFTFSASIDGTKTCYTNTIDRELYNKDITAAQVELVDAYTNYLKWKALDEAPIQSEEKSASASPCCRECSGSGEDRVCSCSCNASDETSWTEYYVSDAQYIYHYVKDENKNYTKGSIIVSTYNTSVSYYEDGHVAGHCSSGCCYASCTDGVSGSAATLAANIDAGLKDAMNKLESAQDKYKNIISQFNGCSEWESNINFEPEIYYDYEEDYIADKYNNYGEMEKQLSGTSTYSWYCNSNILSNGNENIAKLSGNNYDACTQTTSTDTIYTQINYIYCTTSNGCSIKAENISNARYKKTTSTIATKYVPSTLFYNVYPSGEILDKNEGKNNENAVALENELPVSLNTKRGIYKYTVNMKNLGEFYNQDGKLGRLIGGNTAVINREDYANYVNDNGYVEYACSYLVNMGITEEDTIICDFDTTCKDGNCIADCIGPNCDKDCDGNDCIADCIGAGCIYDSDAGTSLIEKVVSLSNLFPNGTNSYNWNREMNVKAETTIDEIQESGNAIYEEEPILSVTITPSVARAIKQYNDEAEGDGGYSNSTLSCYAIGSYEEIACYSSFITGLIDGYVEYDGANLINGADIVNDRSLIMGNNYRTVTDENTKYFTTWSTDISEDKMIGPSWK